MEKRIRPISITILVCLIVFYAVVFIAWDMLAPFERDYTRGPASVVFGLRIVGFPAQVMHGMQLFVALALASGLWTMRLWGWHLVLFVAGYLVISTTVWVAVYQDFERIFFAFLNLVLVNGLFIMTFPHRNKFV
jgi:uncharacterized membrane protein YphA (DoxX/SURF4 family)